MQTVRVSEKTGKDGVLHLQILVGQPEAEFDAVIVLQPKAPPSAQTPEERGWPPGYFDLAGSITDETFMRQPQGELPKATADTATPHDLKDLVEEMLAWRDKEGPRLGPDLTIRQLIEEDRRYD